MDFVHGKWGSIIFILRRYDPVLFPHLSSLNTLEGFPPSAITREVFHQSADEVRIIMIHLPSKTLPFFFLFTISHLHNVVSYDRDIGKALV